MPSYSSTLEYIANDLAPSLDRPTQFIQWAEDICNLLAYIYDRDYDTVTTELFDLVKEVQEYEGDEAD